MRNDLPSMNAGKAMAQASHASNAFVKLLISTDTVYEKLKSERQKLGEAWKNSTNQGFGTVLVLSANLQQINELSIRASHSKGLISNIVIDPTYPYRASKELADLIPVTTDTARRIEGKDGVTLFRNAITCAYIFGDKDSEILQDIVKELSLHP